ncbi:MAG: PHP domain-containing protein, partial [Mycobacteriales bacterium]
MSDPFVHLHFASGYSMRYGASSPALLVERAVEHGMDALALTDRDGTYGAVKFVQACVSAGVRPILGVDLAVAPSEPPHRSGSSGAGSGAGPGAGAPRRTPARGGAFLDDGHPRVTVLARDAGGWAAVCRLVSATHLAGERGQPVTTLALVADHLARSDAGVFVLLGPDSDLGRALAVRRPDRAFAALDRWRAVVDPADLCVEVVHHRGAGDATRAARLLGFAAEVGVPPVLTNAVRYADRGDAPTADVLDAARRLVALDARHVDRANAEACLKSGKEMAEVAEEVARSAGLTDGGRNLLARTRAEAERCAVD